MKYVLGVFAFIILAIVAIVLLSTTTGNRDPNRQEGERIVNLVDYANTPAAVTLTTQGRIVGQENYREIRVTVSRDQRLVEIISGYNGTVERQQSTPNTPEAFDAFMRALTTTGFTRERDTVQKEVRGTCPTGRRFIYGLRQGNDQLVNLWSTSCDNDQGTFGGNDNLTQRLFQNQIPDYSRFVRGVRL